MTSYPNSSATPGGEAASGVSTVPPEIIQLIVNYLGKKELAKVIRLNWTWAQIVAPKLWEEIDFSANANRIVFLITKSVLPQSLPDQVLTKSFPMVEISDVTRSDSSIGSNSSTSKELLDSSSTSSNSQQHPLQQQKRRNSYPWPTLLRYHSMVRTLRVILSSTVMIQDLLDIVGCCNELRSFFIWSSLPCQDFLFRGAIATAYNEASDPMVPTPIPSPVSKKIQSSNSSIDLTMSIDPNNSGSGSSTPSTEVPDDEEASSVTSVSQCGGLFKKLASSCPKLDKLWISGFDPISLLGTPVDLKPRSPKSFNQARSDVDTIGPPLVNVAESTLSARKKGYDKLPPIPPVQGSNSTISAFSSFTSVPVTATSSQSQSKIRHLQFSLCATPPKYLLKLIQHSLPNLEALHLTYCWNETPMDANFPESLAKSCPGLREITLHSMTRQVNPTSILKMLQTFESKSENGKPEFENQREGNRFSKFSNPRYIKNSAPSISSTAAMMGSTSNNNSTSSLSSFSSASGVLQPQQYEESSSTQDFVNNAAQQKRPSDLESISIWFPVSTLDQDIVSELADVKRHPALKSVDFGSKVPFDSGEQLIQTLLESRPGLKVCTWVSHSDTGDDRDD